MPDTTTVNEFAGRENAKHLYVNALRGAMLQYLVKCAARNWHAQAQYTVDELQRLDGEFGLAPEENE